MPGVFRPVCHSRQNSASLAYGLRTPRYSTTMVHCGCKPRYHVVERGGDCGSSAIDTGAPTQQRSAEVETTRLFPAIAEIATYPSEGADRGRRPFEKRPLATHRPRGERRFPG